MDGQELYEEYARLSIEIQNCEVEPWDNLDESDQRLWDALAKAVNS